MKYVCLGYIDESKFAAIPQAEAERMMEECFAYDDELRRGGHFIGGEALDSVRKAVTLRMKDGQVEATDGPYAETKEALLGFYIIDVENLEEGLAFARDLAQANPGGAYELRPIQLYIPGAPIDGVYVTERTYAQ